MKKIILLSFFAVLFTVEAHSFSGEKYEQELLVITENVESGNLQQALILLDSFLHKNPRSRVAHLLKADIYQAMSGGLNTFAEGLVKEKLSRKNFRHELVNRSNWNDTEKNQHFQNKIPASIIDMGTDQYILVGEMLTGRFFLFGNKNGKPTLITDYYMTIGKKGFGKQVEGDNKTPLGVYQVTHEIDGKTLPDLYGSGAFPIDYPNSVDRWRKRTGYGIWLHGTPSETYSRSPFASEGCFVLSNDDYEHIAPYIRDAKNPRVLLLEKINWLNQDEHEQHTKSYLDTLQSWVAGWESLDMQKYFSFYDKENFNFGKTSFNSWRQRKEAVSKHKKFVQVVLEVSGIYLYPGERDMFKVDIKQFYYSNNYQGKADKTLFWKKDEKGKWKIIYEGKQV